MRCRQNAKMNAASSPFLLRVVPTVSIISLLLLINNPCGSVNAFPSSSASSRATFLAQRQQQQQRHNSPLFHLTRQAAAASDAALHSLPATAIMFQQQQQDQYDNNNNGADGRTEAFEPPPAGIEHRWDFLTDGDGTAQEDQQDGNGDADNEQQQQEDGAVIEQPKQLTVKRKLLMNRDDEDEAASGAVADGETTPRAMARSHVELFTRMRSICGRMHRLKRKRTPRPGSPESLVAFLCGSAKFY